MEKKKVLNNIPMSLEEELKQIESQLDELLQMGANDEKLVDRKRELENKIRNNQDNELH